MVGSLTTSAGLSTRGWPAASTVTSVRYGQLVSHQPSSMAALPTGGIADKANAEISKATRVNTMSLGFMCSLQTSHVLFIFTVNKTYEVVLDNHD